MVERIYGLLGLAQRAGKVASGEAAAEANIEKHKACLVILASDASERTITHFTGLCERNHIKYMVIGEKIKYGIAMGKSPRSVVVILDDNFAKSIAQSK
jgi:ribosomal protein L7Ae-like RNA K-turn-binding protein